MFLHILGGGGLDGTAGEGAGGDGVIGEGAQQVGRCHGGGVDAGGAEGAEDTCAAVVLLVGDGIEIGEPVVGGDAVEVVDALRPGGYRSDPREIDGTGDEDAAIATESMPEKQIALFASGIVFVFAVRGCGKVRMQQCLRTVGCDTQPDHPVFGDVEAVAVIRLVRHQSDFDAVVKNCFVHISGSLVRRRCRSSNPVQR